MKKPASDPGGVWLLEEAAGLLRVLPARSWTLLLAGMAPFAFALIDFLMEMSRSAFAEERLVAKSLALAALFVWKHMAQAMFMADCLNILRGRPVALPAAASIARLALVQAAWQPWKIFALPGASLAVIPFPRLAAFFRNVGLSALERPRGFVGEAWQYGRGDVRSHSLALAILFPVWLLLFANLLSLWFIVPMLLKAFIGLQTDFSRIADRVLNVSTSTATMVIAFACVEPLVCAMAAVRAFYVQARAGGEDLFGSLRRIAAALLIGFALFGSAVAPPLHAQEVSKPDAAALDREIDNVLRQPEFAWRMPRSEGQASETTWLQRLFENIGRWLKWMFDLIRKLLPEPEPFARPPASNWSMSSSTLRWLMIAAGVLAVVCIVFLLFSRTREKNLPAIAPSPMPVAAAVDLADEQINPEHRDEDEWLRLADDCARIGEFRLAIRALHLAGLRYLGGKGLVLLQPGKTGAEYRAELERRLRGEPAAVEAYSSGLHQYEIVWYGFHTAESGSYRTLRTTWEEMRRYA